MTEKRSIKRLFSSVRIPIAYKIAFLFTVTIATGMVLMGGIIAHDQSQLLDQQTVQFGSALAKQSAEAAKDAIMADDVLALEVGVTNLVSNQQILGASIYSEDMKPLVQAGLVPPRHVLINKMKTEKVINWQLGMGKEKPFPMASFVARAEFEGVTVGYAVVTFDYSALNQARRDTFEAVAGTTVVLILLGVLISIFVGRRVSRPINTLVGVTESISRGDYSIDVDYTRKDEVGRMIESMSTMCDQLKQREILEQSFARYVSPQVAKAVVENSGTVQLGGRYVEASVVFADVVGFTSLSEEMSPAEVSDLLNEYFRYIAQATQMCYGHVDKYIGDCAMMVFGAPEEDELHAFHAVFCALLIQKVIQVINHHRNNRGLIPVHFRIGVNSGRMLAGNMGSPERMNYTVIGDSVNLASRLSSVASANQIAITDAMFEMLSKAGFPLKVKYHGEIALRGKKEPVAVYFVTDVQAPYQRQMVEMSKQILEV
ncbi:MAG: adenylate/guanylate cyclase domain-containing protein [Pseudomonadota bacterium]